MDPHIAPYPAYVRTHTIMLQERGKYLCRYVNNWKVQWILKFVQDWVKATVYEYIMSTPIIPELKPVTHANIYNLSKPTVILTSQHKLLQCFFSTSSKLIRLSSEMSHPPDIYQDCSCWSWQLRFPNSKSFILVMLLTCWLTLITSISSWNLLMILQ